MVMMMNGWNGIMTGKKLAFFLWYFGSTRSSKYLQRYAVCFRLCLHFCSLLWISKFVIFYGWERMQTDDDIWHNISAHFTSC